MDNLLAKSYDNKKYPQKPPDYALLTQHSRDVANACKALASIIGYTAFNIAELDIVEFTKFYKTLVANGWLQDIGKASSHFQSMVTTDHQINQLLRHETISGLLVWQHPKFRSWLAPLEDQLLIAVWGAMGHHRKFDEETRANRLSMSLTVKVAHKDFATILNEITKDLALNNPPIFDKDIVIAPSKRESGDLIASDVRKLQEDFEAQKIKFTDDKTRRMVALIKVLGIAADVAASAIAAQGQWAANYSLTQYINDTLGTIGLKVEDLSHLINIWAWRTTEIDPKEWNNNVLPPNFCIRPFQTQVAASKSFLTLAKAGCGSGKSLAAYMWAQEWCKKLDRKNFRLFFCLPTTGTTTEHFKDYALESGIDASLTHSRASVDLITMAETAPQEESNEDNSTTKAAFEALQSAQAKLESLALWSTPLVVTTTDTILGLMANARRAIYSFPSIINSVIIFDEIHALDDHLFGHLLIFLKNFPKLPVLLMTASLPEERRKAIEAIRIDLNTIPGPSDLERLPRYLINAEICNDDEIEQAIKTCLANKGKVLWIRNRVTWANATYDHCKTKYAHLTDMEGINIYHSRLRYKDRSDRHRRVIDKFKQKNIPTILIATQVAEMSLDISADLLITDIAPIPALIQRLGRLNRRASKENGYLPKEIMICAPINNISKKQTNVALPYEQDDLDIAKKWLTSLNSYHPKSNYLCPISQYDLTEAFTQFSDTSTYDISKAESQACFFTGLWRTRPGLTRGEGYTISVILEKDLQECKEVDRNGQPTREWLRKYEVAIPIKEPALKWLQIAGIRIAPTDMVDYNYDEHTKEGKGATWRKK